MKSLPILVFLKAHNEPVRWRLFLDADYQREAALEIRQE